MSPQRLSPGKNPSCLVCRVSWCNPDRLASCESAPLAQHQTLEKAMGVSTNGTIFNRVEKILSAKDCVAWLPGAAGELATLVALLGRDLRRGSEEVRYQAACALEEIGPSGFMAVPRLAKALMDESSKVRAKAADALLQMGPYACQAIPALVRALDDPEAYVRHRAVVALGILRRQASIVVPALVKTLADPDREDLPGRYSVRTAGAYALGNFGPRGARAIPTLLQALSNQESTFQRAAISSLARIASRLEWRVRPARRQAGCFWFQVVRKDRHRR
jgi:HEAT repeat protein